jgi:glycosyltransferase involved in cell wall biosynthesis
MRVIHVVSEISAEAAGVSYAVPRLCDSLIGAGTDVKLATLGCAPMRTRLPYLKTFPRGIGPHRLGVSPKMQSWLVKEAVSGCVDIIHNHGLWMMPNVYPGLACRRGHRILVISPHGMLSRWALGNSAGRKRVFWHLFQARALHSASGFHATAESEYEDIRQLGFRQPVCIIPNGIDLPPLAEKLDSGRRLLLFLGRLHPSKGVDILLRAWQAVEDRFPEWELHVAGPGKSSYIAKMQAFAKQLHLKRVVFRGPLYGEEKWRAYQAASLFVLPSHTENFGMTVAESLAAATPVIVSKGAPWGSLEKQGAGWWIDIGVDPLVACLEQTLALPATRLAEMGLAGRAWMEREYSWDRIGTQLSISYRWLLEGGVTPPWIRSD